MLEACRWLHWKLTALNAYRIVLLEACFLVGLACESVLAAAPPQNQRPPNPLNVDEWSSSATNMQHPETSMGLDYALLLREFKMLLLI